MRSGGTQAPGGASVRSQRHRRRLGRGGGAIPARPETPSSLTQLPAPAPAGSGSIDTNELLSVLRAMGEHVTLSEAAELMVRQGPCWLAAVTGSRPCHAAFVTHSLPGPPLCRMDKDGNGSIDFQVFSVVMQDKLVRGWVGGQPSRERLQGAGSSYWAQSCSVRDLAMYRRQRSWRRSWRTCSRCERGVGGMGLWRVDNRASYTTSVSQFLQRR